MKKLNDLLLRHTLLRGYAMLALIVAFVGVMLLVGTGLQWSIEHFPRTCGVGILIVISVFCAYLLGEVSG